MKRAHTAGLGALGAAVLLAGGLAALNASSPTAVWSLLNQLQLLTLLLFTGAFLPSDVVHYLSGSQFADFSFSFMPYVHVPLLHAALQWTDSEQPDDLLRQAGLESGSSLNNSAGFWATLGLGALCHGTVILLRVPAQWKSKHVVHRFYKAVVKYFYNMFTFGFYLRLCIEGYQNLLLASTSEMIRFKGTESSIIVSFTAAILIFCICLLFLAFAGFLFFIRLRNTQLNNDDRFYELYAGVKPSKLARIYIVLALARRLVFIIILMMLHKLETLTTVIILISLQIMYMGAIIALRPFKETTNNLVEIVNEVFFTGFLGSQFHLNSSDRWSDKTTDVFIYFLMSNNFVVMLILLGKLDISYILYRKHITKTNTLSSHKVQKEISDNSEKANIGIKI